MAAAPRWFEKPASEIALHPNSPLYAAALRTNSNRYAAAKGQIQLATTEQGFGITVLDAREGTMTDVYSSKYTPKLNDPGVKKWPWSPQPRGGRVPWNDHWYDLIPEGSDGNVIVYNPDTGEQWGLWGARWENGRLTVYNAWLISELAVDATGKPIERRADAEGNTVDAKGRPLKAGRIVAADMRTYRGNDPDCNGAGVIPRPLTREHLDHGRTSALSFYAPSETFGPAGLVVCPAGKVENNPTKGPSCGGVRFSLSFTDETLALLVAGAERRYQADVRAILCTLRDYGATVDATGPNFSVICGDVDLPPLLPLSTTDGRVEWRVHQPPHGYRNGRDCGTGPGWYDDVRYIA